MKNIAVVGKTDDIKIYSLSGAEEVFKINNNSNLEKLIDSIAKEYKIILVEEEILNRNKKIFLKYKNQKLPAITAIPSLDEKENENFTYQLIKKIVGNEVNI